MSVSKTIERVCEFCGGTFAVQYPARPERYCGRSCGQRGRKRPSLEDRFWQKIDRNGPVPAHRPDLGPCWTWTDAPDPLGYGRIRVGRRDKLAHRLSYELNIGPIPDGLEPDHLCRNRRCVNPEHLEAVTHKTNVLRGESPAVRLHRSGRCAQGHEQTPENVYVAPNGKRECGVCARDRARRHYAKNKEGTRR